MILVCNPLQSRQPRPFNLHKAIVKHQQLPDRTLATTNTPTFECHVCMSDVGPGTLLHAIRINDIYTCEPCLGELVNRATIGADRYPLEINKQPVHLNEFTKVFIDSSLLEKYIGVEQEQAIAPHQRVYCAGEHFLGAKVKPSSARGADTITVSTCLSCESANCMICTAQLDKNAPLADIFKHGCKDKQDETEKDRKAMANGAERGETYQLCPFCERKVHREDACNHIVCHCRGHFCYVCGEPVDAESLHWDIGACPRWPNREEDNQAALPDMDGPIGMAENFEYLARRVHGPDYDGMRARLVENRRQLFGERPGGQNGGWQARTNRLGDESRRAQRGRAGDARIEATRLARSLDAVVQLERERDLGMRERQHPDGLPGVRPGPNVAFEEWRAQEVRRTQEQTLVHERHNRRPERDDEFFNEG